MSTAWVGRPMLRVEDPALVRGEALFTSDLPAARWVRFVRSPVASGRIIAIEAPTGVCCITSAHLGGVKPIRPMLHKFGYVPIEQPVLADGVVRYVGDPMAAVVAASEELAEDQADQILLDIETLSPVTDARQALAGGAPLVHSGMADNVVVRAEMQTAGFDAAWQGAHQIIACDVRSNRQSAQPIEPRAAHAAWDGASGRVTLHCTAQMPHLMRTAIAELLDGRADTMITTCG